MNIKEASKQLTDNTAITCDEMKAHGYAIVSVKTENGHDMLRVSEFPDNKEITIDKMKIQSFDWDPTKDEIISESWEVLQLSNGS